MSIPVLVSCDWLYERQKAGTAGDLVLIDVSWSSQRNCHNDYIKQHIPGARFVDVMDASHCDMFPRNIPHTDAFTKHACAAGVNSDSHVIVYSDTDAHGYLVSGRGWWTFKYFGLENVSVLDGGLQKWIQSGYPVTSEIQPVQEGNFTAQPTAAMKTELVTVADNISNPTFQLVDTRKSELHLKNSIPGAKNVPLHDLVDPDTGTMRSRHLVQQMLEAAGVDLSKPVVTHCNSGMSSCSVALAATHAGATQVSVFHGGFTEWSKKM